jgi:hypothetical protein
MTLSPSALCSGQSHFITFTCWHRRHNFFIRPLSNPILAARFALAKNGAPGFVGNPTPAIQRVTTAAEALRF